MGLRETVGCLGGGSVGGWWKVSREERGMMEKAYLCGSECFGMRMKTLLDADWNASEGRIYIIRYKVRPEEDDDSGRWE